MHPGDNRFDRGATGFFALKLANGDGNFWIKFQAVIDPDLELLQSGWTALGLRLRKEIHNRTSLASDF